MSLDKKSIKAALEPFGENIPELIKLTLNDADNFMAEIKTALEEQNAETVGFSAHALKSIMRQIEATPVADLANALETDGKEGNIKSCQKLFESIIPLYEETKSFLLDIEAA